MTDLHVEKAKITNLSKIKRVSYTNPYAQRKILFLKTDSDHLLRFKDPILDLGPGDTKFISLQFLPVTAISAADILVFLNDEHDHIEECLCIRVHYE